MPDKKISSRRSLVIAVDGPAASGKGTLAARLAAHFELPHLDTGGLYRAVGRKALMEKRQRDGAKAMLSPYDPLADDQPDIALAIHAANDLRMEDLAHGDLGEEWVGHAASIVSAIPQVRAALLDYQHHFASRPGGAVLDGRDIGTVICPNADVKLYITATPEIRATRRFHQAQAAPGGVTYEEVLAAVRARDARDMGRAAAPLKPAEDAVTIDTSMMTADKVFDLALRVIEKTIA